MTWCQFKLEPGTTILVSLSGLILIFLLASPSLLYGSSHPKLCSFTTGEVENRLTIRLKLLFMSTYEMESLVFTHFLVSKTTVWNQTLSENKLMVSPLLIQLKFSIHGHLGKEESGCCREVFKTRVNVWTGLSAKKSGHCWEVVVSGGSTVNMVKHTFVQWGVLKDEQFPWIIAMSMICCTMYRW